MSRHRRIVAALAAIGAAASSSAVTPPAGAGTVSTVITSTSPVTWVDAQDRQLMVATSGNTSVTIARDTPAGDPDPSWGPGGVKALGFSLPAGATTTSARIAADDQGRLTLLHSADGCTALPCDRWFQQIDGTTGATVSGPVEVDDVPPAWMTLEDGSLLLGSDGTALGWYGPDGTERANLPILTSELVHADVDAAGRLLVLDDAGTVHRFTPGGGPVLAVDTPCDALSATAPNGAVGASPFAPGFAVACAVGGGRPAALRYADDGSISWTQPGGAASAAPPGIATDVTVTADGRVWVGARTLSLFPWIPNGTGVVSVTPARSAAWDPIAYQRATGGSDHSDVAGGVVALRPVGIGDEVALADLKVCCRYANNTSPQMAALSAIVPYRPGPPLGRTGPLTFGMNVSGGLTVAFDGATWTDLRANRKPTAYDLDATFDGTTTTVATPVTGSGRPTTATLPDVGGGEVVHAAITARNEYGDSIAGSQTGTTVTPFRSVADFVDHQVQTLHGEPISAADRAATIGALTEGEVLPRTVMEDLLTGGVARSAVESTARIYRAAFLRDPDIGGLRYWVAQRRRGARIATIAEQFARSDEFRRRYGSLGNRAFVERIYQNVLGRAGDAGGIAFWTKRLDTGKATRGGVLAGFSESTEHVRRTNPIVKPLTVTFLMLDRRPTAAEKATWSVADDAYAQMPEAILSSPDYLARIGDR
jgi:hypothetical protein